jgi:AcrR family transcriptional regulator
MVPPTSSTAHPREAVAQHNIEAILEAVERLMARGAAPTVSAVAAEARVSRPTVYAHFPDRLKLFEAVVERTVSQVIGAIASAQPADGPAAEALKRVVAASWAELSRHELIAQAAARELSAEALHRAHHAALAMLRELLERGQADGSFRSDLPVELLVSAALALIHTTADAARHGVLAPDAAGATVEQLISALWRPRRRA